MSGILDVNRMSVTHDYQGPTKIEMELIASPLYDTRELLSVNFSDLFPGKVIVKCSHCGQWCARKTECKYCGAPVD